MILFLFIAGCTHHASPPDTFVDNAPTVLDAKAELEIALEESRGVGWPDPNLEFEFGKDEQALKLMLEVPFSSFSKRNLAKSIIMGAEDHYIISQARAKREIVMLGLERAKAQIVFELFSDLQERSKPISEIARSREKAGMLEPLEFALVQSQIARIDRDLAKAKEELIRLNMKIKIQSGRDEITDYELCPLRVFANKDDLLKIAFEKSESLLEARNTLAILESQVAADRWELLPKVSIGPKLVNVEGNDPSIGLVAGVVIPISNFGKESVIARDRAKTRLIEEQRRVFYTLESLLQAYDSHTKAIINTHRCSAEAAKIALEIAEAQFTAGQVDVLHLLTAQETYTDTIVDLQDQILVQRKLILEIEQLVGQEILTEALF